MGKPEVSFGQLPDRPRHQALKHMQTVHATNWHAANNDPRRNQNAWACCRANMDVLVSLGTNASYLYSIISILHHHFMHHHETGLYRPTDFFETSAMLITFILLGKYLEVSAN